MRRARLQAAYDALREGRRVAGCSQSARRVSFVRVRAVAACELRGRARQASGPRVGGLAPRA
eukprot:1223568-Pleurochrysis_carterae.AAC.1